MYELNIDTWCSNSSSAKGRVERAHLTLQARLVKEMRLRDISTIEAANAYAPSFIAAYNARFAKPPRSSSMLRDDENLDVTLTWREPRRVTKSLTVQYDRVIYLLGDTSANRKPVHRYIEVWEFPGGRIEIRADGIALPYVSYDRLSGIDHGAVIEHKRLGHALQLAQILQARRDSRRASGSPSRTNHGAAVRDKQRPPGTKKQREFTHDDLNAALTLIEAQRPKAETRPSKPKQRIAEPHRAPPIIRRLRWKYCASNRRERARLA